MKASSTRRDRPCQREQGFFGVGLASVQRIYRTHGLQLHRVRRFKLSRDRELVPKLCAPIGM
jgi:hypothetical protein